MSGLIVDCFCGGGGASLGVEMATGRSPDIAVNHDAEAVAMHAANHPTTRHLCGDVWGVRPREVCGGEPVELAWFSPDCKHFSKAKGGKPVEKGIRSLAWVVVRWAREVRPAVICLENVEEFADWGPLLDDGRPCPLRRGLTFRRWVKALETAGYVVETRELRACDYGAPTSRRRLFVIARCDGLPVVWPRPTHGPGRIPHRTAAECIDFSLPCPSIFDRKKSLAEPTLRRIARGIRKYVIESGEPFIVSQYGQSTGRDINQPLPTITAGGMGHHSLVAPTLIHQGNGERVDQAPRIYDLHKPLGTVVAQGVKHALASAFLAKHYGGNDGPGSSLTLPIGTITTQDHHHLVEVRTTVDRRAEVRAFLTKFYGEGTGQPMQLPLGTITTKDRFGLVTVRGEEYEIADIGMRMLTPRELFRAQGFPETWTIDMLVGGKPLSKTAQVRMCGNSVCPPLAAALIGANWPAAGAGAA